MARLKEQYVKEIAPALMKKFGYKSVMQIPKLDKVVINVAAGEAKENARLSMLSSLTWARSPARSPLSARPRRPLQTSNCARACPSAQRSPCAVSVCTSSLTACSTLRSPRVRDFRGINGNSFDGRGNYAFGLKEQLIFPEIDYDKIDASPRHGYLLRHHR